MSSVLIIGSAGQLGQEFQSLSTLTDLKFTFVDIDALDITISKDVMNYFNSISFDYCINCAAYTAVDKAEEHQELAEKINVLGVKNIVNACTQHGVTLIHISTDFVFDGTGNLPISETGVCNPLSVYGKSKRSGEEVIEQKMKEYFILRTSWLYSIHGNNFVKTMLNLSKSRSELGIIVDQLGTPTYARDLAYVILKIIETKSQQHGLYHYSNEGVASWYDFAHSIFEISRVEIKLNPIPTTSYPTPAQRPKYSVLNKTKIKETLGIEIPHWRDSLQECIMNLNSKKV